STRPARSAVASSPRSGPGPGRRLPRAWGPSEFAGSSKPVVASPVPEIASARRDARLRRQRTGGGGWIRTSAPFGPVLQTGGFSHSPTPPMRLVCRVAPAGLARSQLADRARFEPARGETPTRFPGLRLEPLGHLSLWLADGAGFEPAAPLARRSRSATGSVRPLRHPSLMRPAGRGGRIRTGDLRSPRPARYLAAPRPVGADDPGRGRPTRTGGLRAPDASLCLLSYTPEACRRRSAVSLEHAADQLPMFSVDGRGGRIRTGGRRVPNAALCQAELRPVR